VAISAAIEAARRARAWQVNRRARAWHLSSSGSAGSSR